MIRSRAPLRVSLAGGGTDLASYFNEHGGAVLAGAINRYSRGSLVALDRDQVVVHQADLKQVLTLPDEEGSNKLALVQTVLKKFNRKGFRLTLKADVPPGSGLGASSSLVCSLLTLFRCWVEDPADPFELAQEAYQLERVDGGIPGGYQDQVSAAYGGFTFQEYLPGGAIRVTSLRVPQEVVRELEARLVLVYTGSTRLSGNIIVEQEKATASGDNLSQLHAAKALAYSSKKALLAGDLDEVARFIAEGWQLKKKYAPGITTPAVEKIEQVALGAGATAGKLLGAGGGGHFLSYCPRDTRYHVERALLDAGFQVVDFEFENQGAEAWNA